MKINLLLDNDKNILQGYINIDPFVPDNRNDRIKGDVSNLNLVAEDGEIEVLIVRHILCYFPIVAVGQVLNGWLKKIKLGGVIVLEEIDFENICWDVTNGKLNLGQAQKLIWGNQSKQWDVKKSGLSILSIVEYLENSNFKIMKKRMDNYNFVIEAIRVK